MSFVKLGLAWNGACTGGARDQPEGLGDVLRDHHSQLRAVPRCFRYHHGEDRDQHQYNRNPVTNQAKDFDSRQVGQDHPLAKVTGVHSKKKTKLRRKRRAWLSRGI